jgi:hypothetical protein
MIVVMHRPPLKRVEIGSRPHATLSDPYAGYERDNSHAVAEQERIWGLVRQSAEGCNPAGAEA